MRCKPNISIVVFDLYTDLSDYGSIVTYHIASDKLNGMNTVLQRCRGNGYNLSVKRMFNFISVNIHPNGISIQAGCIYILSILNYVYRKTNIVIVGNSGTIALIIKILIFAGNRLDILNFAKNRSLSIVTSFGIIYDKIIHKEGIHTGNTGGHLPVVFAGCTAVKLTAYFYSGTSACRRVCGIPRCVLIKRNTVVAANVYRTVSPTGFLKIQRITIGDGRSIYTDFFSILGSDKAESYSCAHCILGEIYPNADRFCVFIGYGFACPTQTSTKPVQSTVGCVGINGTGAFAIVNHTVSGCYGIAFQNVIIRIKTGFSMVAIFSLLKMLYMPTLAKAVFKIPNHFRCLTEYYLHSCGNIGIMGQGSRDGTAGNRRILCCGNHVSVQGTHIVVIKLNLEVRGLAYNFINTVCSGKGKTRLPTGRNSQNRLAEMNGIGNYDIDLVSTVHFAFMLDLCTYCTGFAGRNKQTVLINGTKGIIRQCPLSTCGNLCSAACNISTNSRELNRASGGKILAFSTYIRANKFSVRRSCCDKANTGGGRTQTTIRRRVVYLQFFTRTLRNESGRTTAVTVCSPNAACRNHNLCTFVHIHTCGERRLTTVVFHHNNLTICSNTYYRTGRGVIMRNRVLIHTIFYNVSAGNRDNCLFPTVKVSRSADLGHFYLGNIRGSRISVVIKVFIDNYASRESNVTVVIATVTRVEHDFAIHHHESERLSYTVCGIAGIPGQAAVHNADNFAVHILVDPVCLVEHCARLIFGRIHLRVRRNYIYVGIVYVSLHNVNNLTISSRIVIQNDFGFGNTGSIVPISLSDDVVVIISTCRSIVIVIDTCCECCERYSGKHTKHRNNRKQE